MRTLFIRHAEAVEADGFDGPDAARPLTKKGKTLFSHVAGRLAAGYPRVKRILSSEAVRARQTAEILAESYGAVCVELCPALNPGASVEAIEGVLRTLPDEGWVAVVGHEPDLSSAVSALVSGGALRLKLKKGGGAEVELPARGAALLRAVWEPKRWVRIGREGGS